MFRIDSWFPVERRSISSRPNWLRNQYSTHSGKTRASKPIRRILSLSITRLVVVLTITQARTRLIVFARLKRKSPGRITKRGSIRLVSNQVLLSASLYSPHVTALTFAIPVSPRDGGLSSHRKLRPASISVITSPRETTCQSACPSASISLPEHACSMIDCLNLLSKIGIFANRFLHESTLSTNFSSFATGLIPEKWTVEKCSSAQVKGAEGNEEKSVQ